jgi:DNA-binding PadR family transcriptional regulator
MKTWENLKKDEPIYIIKYNGCGELKEFIETKTNKTFTCEEQSLYRSLRKFYDLEMVDFENQTGNKGPERKYYFLTPLGKEILKEFIERNIALFYKEEIKKLILE